MRVPFYDIKAQYDELSEPLDAVTLEVLRSGAYVLGPHNRELERELADLHRVKHGIAVASGTDALRILMDANGIGPGDEVITTAFTFVATVEAILQVGATPVFVDIDPDTFQINVQQVAAAITPKTKAILPIHLFGQLCEVKPLMSLACSHGLLILEDAAQALGSTFEGTPAGNFSMGAGFSFYVTKNLGAAGDAGLILTNDDGVAERCRSIRVHGMGRERYYYDHIGYTSRCDEIQAAILRVKLTRLQAWNERRVAIAAQYDALLSHAEVRTPVTLPGNNHTYHQYCIRSERRDELQAHLKEQGVDSMIYYPVPLHFHAPYRHLAATGSLPETERAALEILSLPIHPHLSDAQVAHVAESVQAFAPRPVSR